jgi:hypothetical protein
LHLLSFFESHAFWVFSFDGVAEFLHFSFTALVVFDYEFSYFFFNICFILEP